MLDSLNGEREDIIENRGSLRAEINRVRKRLGAGESIPGSRLSLKQRGRLFRGAVHSRAHFRAIRTRYAMFATSAPDRIAREAARLGKEAKADHRAIESKIRSALGRYALNFPDALEFYGQAQITTTVRAANPQHTTDDEPADRLAAQTRAAE